MSQKILIINSSNKFWGAEVSLKIFLKNFKSDQYELIIRSDGSGFDSELNRAGISYSKYELELSPFKVKFYRSILHLIKILLRKQSKVIYANNEDLSTLVAMIRILTLFSIKTKLHIRNTPGRYDYYKKLMFIHNDVICNSNYTRNSLVNNLNFFFDKRIHLVPNSHGQVFRESILPFNNYKNYFLTVGMINERKAQLDVVQAFNLAESNFSANYMIMGHYAGTNSYLKKIEHYLLKNKLHDRVFIHPFKKDLSSVYSSAIATIIPSKNETFGRVVIESGYYGTPVIVRNIDPLVELIEDGKNGLVWDGSRVHLYELMKLLSNDLIYRNLLGENLRTLVMTNYSDELYCTNVERIILGKN